ncbi:hypothetical protein GC194_14700, partial [bacterium]|nr:hypothetical protein [bacterium]
TPLQTIRRLVTSDSTFYVMNEQGYFLLHPDTANNFGFMFKDSLSHSFAVEKAGLWKQMSTKHTFNALEDQNFYISQSFDLLDEMQRNFEAMGLNINIRGNGKIVLMHWLSPQLYHGLIWQSRKWLVALWAITLLLVLIWISYQQSQALKQANYIATIEEQNKMLQHQRNRLNAAARTLKAKNRQLKMFNQILVHNFRAPIVSLCNLTNLLVHSDTSAEIDTLKPKFDSLANQLNTLIEDVYQAAQVTNNEHIETQWIDLSEEVKNVLTQFKHELADIQAKVTVDYTWRQLKFSKLYLDSILQNLISNAIKYADESKKLELNFATLEVDDALLLRVSDNGIGIDLNKHGGNMFKLHKRFNREKSGKGMGLFMTKTQIEALEGTIEVDSTPGLGTTFIIKFKKYEK